MALTQQDYKNIYSILPTEKNAKGDSTLGLGKMVENLVPPFEEWIETRSKNYCYGWFVVNLKEDGFYRLQSSANLYKPMVLNGVHNNISIEKDKMDDETYRVHVVIRNKKYDTLNFLLKFDEASAILQIQLKNKNEEIIIGNCTLKNTFSDTYSGKIIWGVENIYIEAMITDFSETDTPLFYKCFTKQYSASQSYTNNFFYSEKKDLVIGVFEPGSFKNTRSIFYHRYKNSAPLLMCLFKSDLPWVVDLNNTIVGMDWKQPDVGNNVLLDAPEKELSTQNIRSWFDSVDYEIGEDGVLYAINPLYENKESLSSNIITMTVGGVDRNGIIKLVPNRVYLTSQEQNSNYVDTSNVYHINQNITRYLRQIYDKKKDTSENKKNKGTEKYIKPRTWVYWPQATIEEQKILLCSGSLIDIDNNIYDNSWPDFRLLSKNDDKEENYTSIEYVWVFIYQDKEQETKYIPLGKSQPIIINKDSTNERVSIQKVFGDEYYSNTYIFID